MTKPDPPRGLEVTMEMVDEAQLERIDAMNDDELDRALLAEGIDPRAAVAFERRVGWREAAASNVTELAPRRGPRWVMWLAAAALVVAAIVAIVGPRLGGTDPPVAGQPRPVLPESLDRAQALRDEAARACRMRFFEECARRLDEAKTVDPAGEDAERVKQMRLVLRTVQTPETEVPRNREEKPPLR